MATIIINYSKAIVKTMHIVKASKEHLKQLAVLQKKYMEYHAEIDKYFAIKKNISQMWIKHAENLLEGEDHIILMTVEDDKIVGYMTGSIWKRPPIYKIDRVGRIGDAFVLPEFRRKGIFTRLLEEMFTWMRGEGVKFVEHPVAVKNELGRIVWEKRGFEDSEVFTRRKL